MAEAGARAGDQLTKPSMVSRMDIRVDCYSGYRGEETPRAVWLGDRRVAVETILDRWLAPDHRYFKFRGDDRCIYIIRHDLVTLQWQITLFQDGGLQPPPDSGPPSGNA
jgi:hypothetical protein